MRSSMKALFAPDAPVLSEKKHNSSFRNLASDKNHLFPLGNIGCSSNHGLGLILPPPSSLQLVRDQGTSGLSIQPDVTDRVSNLNGCSPVFYETLETPPLYPLHLDDDISPMVPLPLLLDHVLQRPSFHPSIVESAPLSAEDMNQVITQDITSVVLNDDLVVPDVKTNYSSPIPNTPTIDIAEYGMSLYYRSEKATSTGDPHPKTGVGNTNRGSLLCDNDGLPIISSAIPIYHGWRPSTPPSHGTRTRSLPPHAVSRSSVTCGHRRSRIRQPLETSSPSMTPSPTNSPKLYRLPIHRKEGDCGTQSLKGLSLEPAISVIPTRTSPKRRANMHESIRENTRCSPWNSPIFGSPLALGCPALTNDPK